MIYSYMTRLYKHLNSVNIFSKAAALAYTTLLSIVPLMVLSLAIFRAFPSFEVYMQGVQNFIVTHFLPTSVDTIQQHLSGFVAHAQDLSTIGLLALLFSAVLMIFSMESALNSIWQTTNRKQRIKVFLIYWAVLTLVPLCLGLVFSFSTYASSLPFVANNSHIFLKPIFVYASQLLVISVIFTLFYQVLPNCKVKFLSALRGGIVAAVLLELARVAFTSYISHFPSYKLVYGALSVIPIFLTWLYLSWLIILLGSVVSYVNFRK